MRAVALILGVFLTLGIMLAFVQSMLVPRGSNSVIARSVNATVATVSRAPLAVFRTYQAQDRWLAGVAPVSVLLQLVVYAALLIFTTGLAIYGTTELSLGDAFYQSGSTLTTLGIVEPVNDPSVVISFVAAFLGLVVIAVFIGYLMATYGAFVSRESQMARVALLAGEPAWGPEILARGYTLGLDPREAPDCPRWIDWICDVRMNHRVNPVLDIFRSTDSTRHWVVTMLAVTDAAALRLCLSADDPDPHAVQLIAESSLAVATIDQPAARIRNWGLEQQIKSAIDGGAGRTDDAGLTDEDWQAAVAALQLAGYPLPADLTAVRARFLAIRGFYAPGAYSLAKRLHAVPAPWSGPRRPEMPTMWPERAQRLDAK